MIAPIDLDVVTGTSPRAYGVRFERVDDAQAVQGDYSHVWRATARGDGPEHRSLCAISGPLRMTLSIQGRLTEAAVVFGLTRIYRRNLGEIVAAADPTVVATHHHLPLFAPDDRGDPLARAVVEAETLALALGHALPIARAASSPTLNELRLPPVREWPALEPLLTLQESHGAFARFFSEYAALPSRWRTDESDAVVASLRRCSVLGALALHHAKLEKVEHLMITPHP